MALDATVGGANANSYLTVAAATALINNILGGSAIWTSASDQEAILIEATELLDLLRYAGSKTTDTQALQFPRADIYDRDGVAYADDAIPVGVQKALARAAVWLIDSEGQAGTDAFAAFKSVQLDANTQFVFRQGGGGSGLPSEVTRYLTDFLLPSGACVVRS